MTDRMKALYDNARTQTFSHNGVKITVRESIGLGKIDRHIFTGYLKNAVLEELQKKEPKRERIGDLHWNRISNAVTFIFRTVAIKGKLMVDVQGKPTEFKLPDPEDEESWAEAYWTFLYIDGGLMEAWDNALTAVNKVEPDPEALPGDESSTTST